MGRQITDAHIASFSQNSGSKWRLMPTSLGMKTIVAEDIDHNYSNSEDEKRHDFFTRWKRLKGSQATYKALIDALLTINRKEDADHVYELLMKSSQDKETVTATTSSLPSYSKASHVSESAEAENAEVSEVNSALLALPTL